MISDELTQSTPCRFYRLDATAGTMLFFDIQGASTDLNGSWTLLGPEGKEIFDDCIRCGNQGPLEIGVSGPYTLSFKLNPGAADGSYRFEVVETAPNNSFEIEIGDIVSPNDPGPGAGIIATAGETDLYTFNAVPDQNIFFEVQAITDTGGIRWQLTDETQSILFSDCLACGNPGLKTLTQGGTYTLTVGGNSIDAIGEYSFTLFEVSPNDTFEISIGDMVSAGVPGAGAGQIESPGSFDIYTFDATVGETVFFDMQAFETDLRVGWELKDSQNRSIFRDCLACGDPGGQVLEAGGRYTLTVGTANALGTGTYQFQLHAVPEPERFEISVGDVISPAIPATGAGTIESPGVFDIYTFNTVPGQILFFDMLSFSTGLSSSWELTDANGTSIFRDCLACGDPGETELTLGGTYTLTVGNRRIDDVGTYSFTLFEIAREAK